MLLTSYAILWSSDFATFRSPEAGGSVGHIALNVGLNLAVGIIFAMGEEVGWRGYMLPRLSAIGLIPAMLLVGFLQGIWHLPIMLMTSYYHSAGNMLFVVPLFLVTLTLAGVFYGFLRVSTGSVWPVAIAHTFFNAAWNILGDFTLVRSPEAMEYLGGESGLLVIAGLSAAAVVLIRRMRAVNFIAS